MAAVAPPRRPVHGGTPPGPWREFWMSFSANRGAVAAWCRHRPAAAGAVRALDRAARAGRDQQRRLPEAAGVAGRRLVEYLLGTDAIGRDILSRLIYGARACRCRSASPWC
jgi:dipeptide transport system permease protein